MSYEIPILIGSLVDRAIQWENYLPAKKEIDRVELQRLVHELDEMATAVMLENGLDWHPSFYGSPTTGPLVCPLHSNPLSSFYLREYSNRIFSRTNRYL